MTSIRRRTASLVILSMFGLLAFGGAALFVVIRGSMTAHFDDALAAKAAALRAVTVYDDLDDNQVEMNIPEEPSPTGSSPGDGVSFVAWVQYHYKNQDSLEPHDKHDKHEPWRVLESSDAIGSADEWPGPALRDAEPGVYDLPLPSGAPGRITLVEFVAPYEDQHAEHEIVNGATEPLPPPIVRLAVATSRAGLDRSLSLIAWCITGVCVAFAIASVAATRWAVTLGLAPLTDLSARVQTLGPDTLATRLDTGELPAELRPIADQLNALLARLDEAFQREQRFSAAASHELRTPIAELRMLLEVAASQPRTGEQWARTADTALGVLARAQSLSETLLRLSRAAGTSAGAPTSATPDVASLITEEVRRSIATNAAATNLVRVDAPPAIAAPIDPAALASIVGNLIDNALRHGDPTPDSPITIRASAHDAGANPGDIHINITNPTTRLSPAHIPHLFEPFWQREASRTDRRGFGLGLAVARTLARAAGGDITASLDPTTTTLTMRVNLPSR